jgi:hypothetical protein
VTDHQTPKEDPLRDATNSQRVLRPSADERECKCPVEATWRYWDISIHSRTGPLSVATKLRLRRAERARAGIRLRTPEITWTEDRDETPNGYDETGWYRQYGARREHGGCIIDGQWIHIDRVWATRYGPGRAFAEIQIHVDGKLAGRGGRAGALGGSGCDLPACAVIGRKYLLIVGDSFDERFWPPVSLYALAPMPPDPWSCTRETHGNPPSA